MQCEVRKSEELPKATQSTVEVAVAVSNESKQCGQWRESVAVGLNELSRCLEKRQLRLALVDSVVLRPSAVGSFLGLLACSSEAATYSVDGLSDSCAPLLGLRSAAAIGFKIDSLSHSASEQLDLDVHGLVRTAKHSLRPVHLAASAQTSADFVRPVAVALVSQCKRN